MEGVMTEPQKTLARYIFGSSGTCYQMSDFTKNCIVGMLQTGEITEADFDAINSGDTWLEQIKEYAQANGWTW